MPQRKLPPADPATQAAASELRRAWDEMLVMVGEARNAIDDPTLWPPDPSRRNLAEGYRYVTGFLYLSLIHISEPTRPY